MLSCVSSAQLKDLQSVVSRMLGVDYAVLPNDELIKLLETILHAHHHHHHHLHRHVSTPWLCPAHQTHDVPTHDLPYNSHPDDSGQVDSGHPSSI